LPWQNRCLLKENSSLSNKRWACSLFFYCFTNIVFIFRIFEYFVSPDFTVHAIFTIEIILNLCINNCTVFYYSILLNDKKCSMFSLIQQRHQGFFSFIWRLSWSSLLLDKWWWRWLLICHFSSNKDKSHFLILCQTMTTSNLFYLVEQWQALLHIYRYWILSNLQVFSCMTLMFSYIYIFYKSKITISSPLLEFPDCIFKAVSFTHIEPVFDLHSLFSLHTFLIVKFWEWCHYLDHQNVNGLAQITLTISVPYGCMCSERSISIHSRFL